MLQIYKKFCFCASGMGENSKVQRRDDIKFVSKPYQVCLCYCGTGILFISLCSRNQCNTTQYINLTPILYDSRYSGIGHRREARWQTDSPADLITGHRGFRFSFFCHLDFARHDILISLARDDRAAASVVGRAARGVTAGGVLVTRGVALRILHGARVVRGHTLHDLTV